MSERRDIADPGLYDESELSASIERGRLDASFLRARAWCDDVQAMCMYADWLLHKALDPELETDPDELIHEAREWLRRAMQTGSKRAAGMLGELLIEHAELPDDRRLGVQMLRGAAFAGDAAAMRRLGIQLHSENQASEARRWLIRAAAKGDSVSEDILVSLELSGGE